MSRESSPEPFRRIPTHYVPQTEADIGSALSAARAKKGCTLEAAAQQTRIPKKFLSALEGNRLEEFPAMAYLRGFLKNYCDFLEVDFDPLWKLVAPEPQAQPAPEANGGGKSRDGEPKPAEDGQAAPEKDGPSFAGTGAVLAALVLAALLLFLALRSARERRKPEAPPPPAAFQPVAAPPEPRLAIECLKDAWLSVGVDGETKFEGRVPQGARQEWKARRYIILRAADPSSLKLTLNDAGYTLPSADPTGSYRIETP